MIRMLSAKSMRGRKYNTHETNEKCLQNCEGNTTKENTTLENRLYKAGYLKQY